MAKILVVDDHFVNRKLMVEMIGDLAACDVAVDGIEALEAYELSLKEKKGYDVILLDIAMPELDGIEVLRRIREMESNLGVPSGRGVPVIVITAYKSNFADSFKGGCDDYILKPVDAHALRAKISNFINGKISPE